MPNLKDIRSRIKSIKNTQKITQAMRMVAAAKVRKAEDSLKASRPYTDLLQNMMVQVLPEISSNMESLRGSRFYDALQPHHAKRVGLFVIAADRGLCGSYNASIIKAVNELIIKYQRKGQNVRLYLVGNKIVRYIKKYHTEQHVIDTISNVDVPVEYVHAEKAGDAMLEAFLDNRIDQIEILYTRFENMVSYIPTHDVLLPLNLESFKKDVDEDENKARKHELQSELEFEPDAANLVEELIPMYLKRRFYSAMLESSTSELAARMTAMDNASNNAKDLIYNLTLVYNKARQAAITQEIMEIVGGAEALT